MLLNKYFLTVFLIGLTTTQVSAYTVYRPYWTIYLESSFSQIKNETYNMGDGFGKGYEFGHGAGIGAGIRADNEKLYFGVEGFFSASKLYNKKATQFNGTESDHQELYIYSIFNAKANIGYNFNKRVTIFGSLGLKHIEYESTHELNDYITPSNSGFRKFNDWVIAPTFGFGVGYFISNTLEARLNYEYSFFKINDNIFADPKGEGEVKVNASTIRLGLNYTF